MQSQCFELLGASGNFASIINNCFGNLHNCETNEIRRLIKQRGYAVHIWTDVNKNNRANIRALASKVIKTQDGELVKFKQPMVLWIACTANIRSGTNRCPRNLCKSQSCCSNKCNYKRIVRISCITEAIIPNKNVLLQDWLNGYKWLLSCYKRTRRTNRKIKKKCKRYKLTLRNFNNHLKQRIGQNPIVFKITYAKNISHLELNYNDFRLYNSNLTVAQAFSQSNRLKLQYRSGELLLVRCINSKGRKLIEKFCLK